MKITRPIICLFTLFTVLSFGNASYAQPVSIAITPFSIKAGPDLSYLGNGIIDLFASRLAMKDTVDIVEKGAVITAYGAPSTDPLARLLNTGKKTNANYVLTGSLEISTKGNVALNAYVIDMNTGKPALEMSEKSGQFENADTIIPLVDLISAKINKGLFSRETPINANTKAPESSIDVHSHPDKLIEGLDLKKEKK